MELLRSQADVLLKAMGWESVSLWDNKRVSEKLTLLGEVKTSAEDRPKALEAAKILIEVEAAIEAKETITVVADPEGTVIEEVDGTEAAPAETQKKRGPKAKVDKPAKEKKPVKSLNAVVAEGQAAEAAAVDGETVVIPEAVPDVPLVPGMPIQQSKTTVEVVDGMRAEAAQEILGPDDIHNQNNRKFGQFLFCRYRDLMLQGNWDFGLRVHVIIDTNNDVQNAQHVLRAFIAAEEERLLHPARYPYFTGPIRLDAIIERGLNPSSANFIDIGKMRNHPDIIYRQRLFEDLPSTQQLLAARSLSTALKIVDGRKYGAKPRGRGRFEHATLLSTMADHAGLISSTKFILGLDVMEGHQKAIRLLRISPAYLICAHYLAGFSDMDAAGHPLLLEEADDFFRKLAFGEGLTEDHPIYVLREWLLRQPASKSNEDMNRSYDALVQTWLCVKTNTQLSAKRLSSLKPANWIEMGGLDTYKAPAA